MASKFELVSGYKFDNNLTLKKDESLWNQHQSCPSRSISDFPSIRIFIHAAANAYGKHSQSSDAKNSQGQNWLSKLLSHMTEKGKEQALIPEDELESSEADLVTQRSTNDAATEWLGSHDFRVLCVATNLKSGNGYYGVAFINQMKRQIILSHRGTIFKCWGAVKTDFISIFGGKNTAQVSSAMTFAHIISNYACDRGFELFFTGHSLGAWLAQVTCFSTKYLTLNKTKHFVGKKSQKEWDKIHPYTVVFESPGAKKFLDKIKDNLFDRNDPTIQRQIQTCCLPVEVLQFGPNTVTGINIQVGVVFVLSIGKDHITVRSRNRTWRTHGIDHTKKIVDKKPKLSDAELIRGRSVDWRMDDALFDKMYPVDLQRFPDYLLSETELTLVKEESQRILKNCTGSYEGMWAEDEKVSRRIVELIRKKQLDFGNDNGTNEIQTETLDRRESVPLLRRFVRIVKKQLVWFNGVKPVLPKNYLGRKLKYSKCSLFGFISNLPESEKFVFLVDEPGMGKSTELTKLEEEMRLSELPEPRVITRINLNDVVSQLNGLQCSDAVLNIPELIKIIASWIIMSYVKNNVGLYVLLDGLDEVLPEYKQIMIKIVQCFLSDGNDNLILKKLVITSRPHLKELIEEQFSIKAHSLKHLSPEEQCKYLVKELGVSEKEARARLEIVAHRSDDTPMGNPLMLYIFSEVGFDASSEVVDLETLYTKFIDKKIDAHLVGKQSKNLDRPDVKREQKRLKEESLALYNFLALKWLVPEKWKVFWKHIELYNNGMVKEPNETNIDEMISIGLIMKERDLKFKHRSFAEYFYARMIADQKSDPQFKNTLFVMYFQPRFTLARFLPQQKICDIISKGWTDLLPLHTESQLYTKKDVELLSAFCHEQRMRYLSAFKTIDGILLKHILEKTIDYTKKCPRKNELLVKDTYEDQVFIKWLLKRPEIEAREILLHENMSDVLIAVVTAEWFQDHGSHNEVKHLLLNDEDRIKERLIKNPATFQIATKWLYLIGRKKTYTEFLLDRMKKWLSPQEIKQAARLCLGGEESFVRHIVNDLPLSKFFACLFSSEEFRGMISDETERITDIAGHDMRCVLTCWGKEFCPKKLLKYRFKFGQDKGKTLFNSNFIQLIPGYLMRSVWDEIGENVDSAMQVILDDGNICLMRWLEKDLRCLEKKKCHYSDRPELDSLLNSRLNCVTAILNKVNWHQMDVKISMSYLVSLFAYGRFEGSKWEELLSNKLLRRINLQEVSNCLLISAIISEDDKTSKTTGVVGAPFLILKHHLKLACQKIDNFSHHKPIFEVLMEASEEVLARLARMKTKHPRLLIDFPSVWEIMFLSRGLLSEESTKVNMKEQMTTTGWELLMGEIIVAVMNFELPCCTVVDILDVVLDCCGVDNAQKMCSSRYHSDMGEFIWYYDVGMAKCYLKGVINFHLKAFKSDWKWVPILVKKMPVQLLVVAAENGWTELVREVEKQIQIFYKNLLQIFTTSLRYNRACDWYKLLLCIEPELKKKIPLDYENQVEVHQNWKCCLLRVWICIFKEKITRRDADLNNGRFWESKASDMNDGELLHIAVEVESITGVKFTAWPGMLKWRCRNTGKTALEASNKKWGPEHEISQFLQKEHVELNLFFSNKE